jgi:hypothetical protein
VLALLVVGVAGTSTVAGAQTIGDPQRQSTAALTIRELTIGERPTSFVNQSFRVVCQRGDGVFVSASRTAVGGNPMQLFGTVTLAAQDLPGVASGDLCRIGFVTDNRADRLEFTLGSAGTIPSGPDDWFRAAGFTDVVRSSASVPSVSAINLVTVYENDLTVTMAGPGAHEVNVVCNSGGPRVIFGLAEGATRVVNGVPAGGRCNILMLNPAFTYRIQETNGIPNDGQFFFRSRRACQESPQPECVFSATIVVDNVPSTQPPSSGGVPLPTVPVSPPASPPVAPPADPNAPTTVGTPSTTPPTSVQPAPTTRRPTTRRTTVAPKPATTKPSRPVATVCKTVGGRKYCGPLSSALKPGQAKPKSVPPTTKKKKR